MCCQLNVSLDSVVLFRWREKIQIFSCIGIEEWLPFVVIIMLSPSHNAAWVLRVCVTRFFSAVFACHYVILFIYVCCIVYTHMSLLWWSELIKNETETIRSVCWRRGERSSRRYKCSITDIPFEGSVRVFVIFKNDWQSWGAKGFLNVNEPSTTI